MNDGFVATESAHVIGFAHTQLLIIFTEESWTPVESGRTGRVRFQYASNPQQNIITGGLMRRRQIRFLAPRLFFWTSSNMETEIKFLRSTEIEFSAFSQDRQLFAGRTYPDRRVVYMGSTLSLGCLWWEACDEAVHLPAGHGRTRTTVPHNGVFKVFLFRKRRIVLLTNVCCKV